MGQGTIDGLDIAVICILIKEFFFTDALATFTRWRHQFYETLYGIYSD